MLTVKTKAYDGRYMEVTCEQTPNVAENTSLLRWTLTVKGGESSYYSTGPTTLTIAGQQVYYCKRKSHTTKVFPAAKGSVSGSLTVAHNEDGSLTVPVRLTTAFFTQNLLVAEADWQLTPIARASIIRAADAFIGSCATVVVTRRSESFSHAIAWEFGGLSGWLNAAGEMVDAPVQFTESTLNFLLPESFYGQIPNDPRGSCTLRCSTYKGDDKIGEEFCAFWANADPEVCRPQVNGFVEAWDDLTQALSDRLIPGISTARCHVTATAQKGASLQSLTAGDTPVEGGEVLLPGWALDTVPVVAVDSRGFETRISLPSPCLPYVQLTVLAEAQRPEPTADSAVVTLSGACFGGDFGATENDLMAQVTVNGETKTFGIPMGDGSYEAAVAFTGLSYLRSYPVSIRVWAKAMAVDTTVTVRKGLPVFDWGENDFRFHVPVDLPALTIGGIPLVDYIRSIIQGG